MKWDEAWRLDFRCSWGTPDLRQCLYAHFYRPTNVKKHLPPSESEGGKFLLDVCSLAYSRKFQFVENPRVLHEREENLYAISLTEHGADRPADKPPNNRDVARCQALPIDAP